MIKNCSYNLDNYFECEICNCVCLLRPSTIVKKNVKLSFMFLSNWNIFIDKTLARYASIMLKRNKMGFNYFVHTQNSVLYFAFVYVFIIRNIKKKAMLIDISILFLIQDCW